jgi:2',3'-cyclic-nucleotide 2'-phosphodiesterase (5'-nucleotidase family)
VYAIAPFNNLWLIYELSGEELARQIENGFRQSNFGDQMSGLTYTYINHGTAADPDIEVVSITLSDGREIVKGVSFEIKRGEVVALVGETSVRVREVYPQMIDELPTGPMAADRTYKLTNDLLPAAPHSVFIKDQEKGDLKRIKPGYYQNPEDANRNCFFYLDSFANAHKCNGESMTTYESWYA